MLSSMHISIEINWTLNPTPLQAMDILAIAASPSLRELLQAYERQEAPGSTSLRRLLEEDFAEGQAASWSGWRAFRLDFVGRFYTQLSSFADSEMPTVSFSSSHL